GDIQAIIFSTTKDIHAYHPAKAARECGFERPALFAAIEPDIEGGLPLCIRVLVFAEGVKEEKHVYLGKATVLRKDRSTILNIALDGPAGSGKSTIAKELAKDYNILYLDTGAMYRACALKLQRTGTDISDEASVKQIIDGIDLTVRYEDGLQHTILDGEDVSKEIRLNEISKIVSTVAALPCVREEMVKKQREIAKNQSCVLDGRDIGTTVLPDAPFKFFITASAEIRAERRLKELKERGNNTIDFQTILKEINERDERDSNREISPLKRADDAEIVDTSGLSIEEVVSLIRAKIQEKI
ncbi:MAG: (d)CMP kinase, partial [Clostridia bacterium]|nr:(d)CMP kinase [Clostridia bacterium]